jgi:hypothetical protein
LRRIGGRKIRDCAHHFHKTVSNLPFTLWRTF